MSPSLIETLTTLKALQSELKTKLDNYDNYTKNYRLK